MTATDTFNQRKITIPIAVGDDVKSGTRRSTQDICLSFNRIYAVSSANGSNEKGARIYTKERPKALHAAQTYTFSKWQEELNRTTEIGLPVYLHNFVSVGSKLMVNLDLMREGFLDMQNNRLCLPPVGDGECLQLDKAQITFLTERMADQDNASRHRSMTSTMKDIHLRSEMRDRSDMNFGCSVVLLFLTLVNLGLLITVLCLLL